MTTQDTQIQAVIDYCQKQVDANSDEALLWAQCKSLAQKAQQLAGEIITEAIEKDRFDRRDVLNWEVGYKCGKAECSLRIEPLVDTLRLVAEPGHSGLSELRIIAAETLKRLQFGTGKTGFVDYT